MLVALVVGVGFGISVFTARAQDAPGVDPRIASGGMYALVGYSVALSADGHTALVGEPGAQGFIPVSTEQLDSLPVVGGVQVLVGSGLSWTFQGELSLPFTGPEAQTTGGDPDAAWVYARSGSTWREVARLTEPTTGASAPRDGFGASLALSADGATALVGAPYPVGLVTSAGAGSAWVFTDTGSSWSEEAELAPPATGDDAAIGDGQFGTGLALASDGATALVGAPHDDGGVGAAWSFGRSGSVWAESQTLTAPTGGPDAETGDDQFGTSVALASDAETALVGYSMPVIGGTAAAWVFTGGSP